MKQFFCITALLIVFGCNQSDNKKPATADSLTKALSDSNHSITGSSKAVYFSYQSILDSLVQLPFISNSNHYIDSFSRHKHGIAFMVDSTKTPWLIQAGYNGKDRFETYHWLYVNPANFDIKVYDVVNDIQLSVADYLKKEN